jgi:hypothetical protein
MSVPVDRLSGHYRLLWRLMPGGWAAGVSSEPAPPLMPHLERRDPRAPPGDAARRVEPLVDGVLLGWFETARFGARGSAEGLHRFLADLLTDLAARLGRTPDALVLEAGARVRARHGPSAAARALTAGVNVVPRSTRVRARLLLEVLALLESEEGVDAVGAAAFAVEVYRGIDPRALDPRVIERLDYLYLLALTALGETGERNRFFWRSAIARVRDPELRARMIDLLRRDAVSVGRRAPSPVGEPAAGSRPAVRPGVSTA